MTINVIAVHPATVMVSAGDRKLELPLAAFPTTPRVGQHWNLSLEHEASEAEQYDQLNRYLARD